MAEYGATLASRGRMPSIRCGAIILLAMSAAAACGDDGSKRPAGSAEEVADRVGIVLPIPLQSSYRALEQALVAALGEEGHDAVSEDGITGVAEQSALLARLTANKARAIVIAPLDSVALRPAIDAAHDASIPVFTVGLSVPGASVTTHTEPDHFAAGVIAAVMLGRRLGKPVVITARGTGRHGNTLLLASGGSAFGQIHDRGGTGQGDRPVRTGP